MSTCPACQHPVTDHGRIGGCLAEPTPGYVCLCMRTRRTFDAVEPSPTPAQAVAQTEAALDQVAAGTEPAFVDAATDAVAHLARTQDAFTVDDVWDMLAERGALAPREPRALGPIMKAATREGLIHALGWASSRRRHQAPVRVYSGRDL